ncbi:MAG: DUF3857 domain-containing transglutaminase family protein [Cellvibrionaceae bacterium]
MDSYDINKETQGSRNVATLYHLVDNQSYFSKNTKHTYYRFVSTPLNSSGLEQNGKINIVFSEAYEKVELHYVRILRNGKLIDLTNKLRIREFRTENQVDMELYNDSLTFNAIIRDLRIGDKLDMAYSVIGANPILEDFYSSVYSLAWAVPVDNLFIRVIDALNNNIYSSAVNTDIQPSIKKTKWGVEHVISLTPTSPFQTEEESPPSTIQGPKMLFSNTRNWSEVSNWANKIFSYDSKNQSKAWRSWVKQVQSQLTNEEKVIKALALVQNEIRYVGIEVGVNSHKPRDPSEVIENRYGDCKDKTLLLVSLLRENGIQSNPVFVSLGKRGAVNKLLPSISAFDHVIAEVEVDGKKYWLDPTASFQKAGHLSEFGYANYEYGLALSSPTMLSPMPVESFYRPVVNITERYYLRANNTPVYLEVDVSYSGSRADQQRRYFNTYSTREIGRKYQEFYSKYYKNVTPMSEVMFSDEFKGNVFHTKEKYLISGFFKKNNDGQLYYNVWPSELYSNLGVPKLDKRLTPFYMGGLIKFNHKVEVYYSTQTHYQYKPIEIDHKDKYRDLQIKTWDVGNKSVYKYSYQSYQEEILPEDIEGHKVMIEKALEDIEFSYTLSDYVEKKDRSMSQLYDRMDEMLGGVK